MAVPTWPNQSVAISDQHRQRKTRKSMSTNTFRPNPHSGYILKVAYNLRINGINNVELEGYLIIGYFIR